MEEQVKMTSETMSASVGSAGLADRYPGTPTTVSSAALANGGIAPGAFIEQDIDEELFSFESEETPLMSLMLKAKTVNVSSPVVEHYAVDQSVATIRTTQDTQVGVYVTLPLDATQQAIPRTYTTLLAKGIDGYDRGGMRRTFGRSLMLFVTGRSSDTGMPIVRAVNGPKANPTAAWCNVPVIPAGTELVVLANALYETQKEVDPELIVPQPTTIYLQKRGMNQVVSDYFEAQKKRIPFTKQVIAEAAILEFKRRGNRTLWTSRAGKFEVDTPKVGVQTVYTTEGVRWQFKREIAMDTDVTFEDLIAIAKMYFTGEDVPKSALLLAGKNLLERIQCIDFSKHPEATISVVNNETLGWSVTRIHTVFGDIDIKREPALDAMGWSNSGALIGENRLVHYVYKSETSFNDNVEGEEAKRSGVLIWDGLALKGNCHIWLNGDGDEGGAEQTMHIYDGSVAIDDDPDDGYTVILVVDCPDISPNAKAGQVWMYEDEEWHRVNK